MKSPEKNCWLITIGGYDAVVDPDGLIVDTADEIAKLRNQILYDVYQKYKKRAAFVKVQKTYYPLIVSDDKLKAIQKKNPIINKLIEKFELDTF